MNHISFSIQLREMDYVESEFAEQKVDWENLQQKIQADMGEQCPFQGVAPICWCFNPCKGKCIYFDYGKITDWITFSQQQSSVPSCDFGQTIRSVPPPGFGQTPNQQSLLPSPQQSLPPSPQQSLLPSPQQSPPPSPQQSLPPSYSNQHLHETRMQFSVPTNFAQQCYFLANPWMRYYIPTYPWVHAYYPVQGY